MTKEELELINEKLISITYDDYGEVLNGKSTYKGIAKLLKDGKTVGIGWTDMLGTHLDIIFKLGLDVKFGNFQRGIKASDLFVSIIGFTSYGFKTDSIKEGTYIQGKLDMRDETGDELANLINGIIGELNEILN